MCVCVCELLEVKRVVMHVMLTPVPKGKLGTSVLVEALSGLTERERERGSTWWTADEAGAGIGPLQLMKQGNNSM